MSWAINFPCPSDEHTHYPDPRPKRLLGTFSISWDDQSKVIRHQKFWPPPAMLGGVCGIWVSFGRGPVKPLTNRATWLWGWPKEYIEAFKCHQRGTCERALETMKEPYIYSSGPSQTYLKTIDVHIRVVLMTGIFQKYQYWWLGLGSSWKCHCD